MLIQILVSEVALFLGETNEIAHLLLNHLGDAHRKRLRS